MHKLLEKCKKTIARKLTGSQRPISQWLPKPAKRKLTHFYNHKKRFGSRSRQQNLKLYDARCYRVVVFECAQVILPQVQTFLKGLKKFVRRLPSAMSRPTVLTYFYNLFWSIQTRRPKGSRMGSGKSSVVSNTALVNPGAVLLATSELLGKSSFYLLQQNKKKLSPFTKIKFAIFVF